MNEDDTIVNGIDGYGVGFDDDSGDEVTPVADVASLHLIRAGRAIVKHGNASARFGEALGGIGLAMRWSTETAQRKVMKLIAAQDKVREAKKRYLAIIDNLDDIDRMVENEANSLHLEENGP